MQHGESQFQGAGGLNLYYQYTLPPNEPSIILLVIHGLAEHSGRYGNLMNHMVSKEFGVYSYDLRGHGKSEGLKGHVDHFTDYVDDLDIFLNLIRDRHPHSKIFLAGHSMGGTIATSYSILHQEKINGLILSGALLRTPASVKAGTILLARILSALLPKFDLYYIDAESISRDNDVVNAYKCDPQVYHGKIRARLGVELITAMDNALHQSSKIRLPILVMHGTADRLSAPQDSEILYEKASSEDKTLKLYEGFFHEIFNEPDRERVLSDLAAWLNLHR